MTALVHPPKLPTVSIEVILTVEVEVGMRQDAALLMRTQRTD